MNKRFYEFSGYRLDTTNHRLLRGGETIALTPKEFEVLLALVENAGNVLSKDELLDTVWKDVFVNEETLMRNISWLRKKLVGDEKFIETVPKRGYLFTAQVTTSDAAEIYVEEQTIQRISIEDTLTISDAETRGRRGEAEKKVLALPNIPASPRFRVPVSLWLTFGFVAIAAISFIVYQNFILKSSPKIVFAGRVVPFAGLPGIEVMPAFSPDSKQIVFGWNGGEGEILDVYVKIIGASEPVRLTKGESNAYFPVFAPDGRNVAFFRSSPETSKIFSVSALGGAERKIADVQSGGTGFSFSPDGKTIATADRDAETSANGIFFVDVETGAKTRLTAPPENFNDSVPRFSPDGKSIVFVRSGGWENQDLFVVKTGGGEPRRLTLDGSRLFGAAWSADGGRVIYSSTRGESSINLWQIAASGGAPELLMAGGKNPTTPVVAPDGKTIAFVEETQDTNIWQLKDEGGRRKDEKRENASLFHPSAFIPHPLIASTRADHSPNISPDGKRIVFVSLRTGDSGIWTAAADGSNPLLLANGTSPRFSPDGKFVVFVATAADRDAIFTVSAEGGAPRSIVADSARNQLPSWSADGRWIYFRSNRGGEFNLWRIASDGTGEAVQITKNGAYESSAAPDDTTVYFTKDRETVGLWRVSMDGGGETPVAELAEAGFRRSWTIADNGIYFVARAEQPPYKIEFYDFSNKQISEITTTDKPPILDSPCLSVSEDGKTILYAQYDQNAGSIMIAELE